jgi:hypothetical protein
MSWSPRLVAAASAAALVVLPAIASADPPPRVAGPRADGIVWVDPPEVEGTRRSTPALITGLSLIGAGAVAIPVGAVTFATVGQVDCAVVKGGGFRGGSCGGSETGQQILGGVVIGAGITAILTGVPLAIWGGSHQHTEATADVRVGPRSVTTTFRF